MNAALTRHHPAPQQAPDVTPEKAHEAARYIGQMTGEMILLARGARLDLLAYFLEMARIEAQTITNRGSK
jgi:hypothetical protein